MKKRTSYFRVPTVIPIDGTALPGEITLPEKPRGLVIFAHDTPGSRHCTCNTFVADALHAVGIGSLLFDLLSEAETGDDTVKARLCTDIPSLAGRLVRATRTVITNPLCGRLSLGYCGACAGGAAALVAAAWLGKAVEAVVARATVPDLAGDALHRVVSPSLFVVAEQDAQTLRSNARAAARMQCERELAVVPGAVDLFSEQDALRDAARLSTDWFDRHLHPA